MATKLLYKNEESLEPINRLINEVAVGLGDKERTIESSSMPEVLGAAIGGGLGAAGSFAALYILGTTGLSAVGITTGLAVAGKVVGGGMVAGIGVLAAPIALGAVGVYALFSRSKAKRLKQIKEQLLKDIIAKHDTVLQHLKNRLNISDVHN